MNSLYCVEICHAGGMKGKDIFSLMILNIQFAGFCIPLNSPSSPLQLKSPYSSFQPTISTSSTFYLQQHKISSPIIRTVNFPPKNRVSERARNFHLNIKGENPSEELTTWERNLLQEKWIFHEWKRHLEKKVFLQERLCFRSPHECLGNQVFFGSTT